MNPKIDERIKEEENDIKIKGEFKIYLGNKLYAKGKNKWTRFFASSIVEVLITVSKAVYNVAFEANTPLYARGLSASYTARAGNDTSTPTSPDMTDLVSKIDIAPDTQNTAIFKKSNYLEYTSRHKFVWNAGTIPAQTIGEFGVYLLLTDDSWSSPAENPNFGTRWYAYPGYKIIPIDNASLRLGARISSGDEDFNPIDYTSEEALILEWYVTIKF